MEHHPQTAGLNLLNVWNLLNLLNRRRRPANGGPVQGGINSVLTYLNPVFYCPC